LISEGSSPYRDGALSTWCHRLATGLDEYDFHPVTVLDATAGRPDRSSVARLVGGSLRPGGLFRSDRLIRPGGLLRPDRLLRRGSLLRRGGLLRAGGTPREHRRAATHAAVLLCRGMLDDGPHSAAMFRSGLRRLAVIAADGTHPLSGVPLATVLLDAWRAGAGPAATVARLTGRTPGTGLPWPSLRDAQVTARVLERAVRALCVQVPEVDLCHAANGGLATLVALGVKWRREVPYVLTEHDLYVHAPLIDQAGGRPAVRAILLRFLRALTRLGYAEAAAIALPTERMRRWAMRHGAGREVLRVVPPGVDPRDHPQLRDEPAEPVVVWVGPDGELPLILRAFATLRETVPDARLIVAGPAREVPDPDLVPPDRVGFTGSGAPGREAYAAGRIVVISGAHRSMPYPLIESMLCARATVVTDNGGLTAMAGMGALVVPPGDPERLAAACASLLTDARLRREFGTAARHRARTLFSLNAMLDGFRTEYGRVLAQRPAPTRRTTARDGVAA
jgi:glycosyltransferase involved in cell wall biosynthesis